VRRKLLSFVAGVIATLLAAELPAWQDPKLASPAGSSSPRKFEVASIRVQDGKSKRPIDAKSPIGGGGLQVSGSLVTIRSVGLYSLITKAYRAQFSSSDRPVPDTVLEIRAKMPEGATVDMISEMLQSLLKDRFSLSVHWDKQAKKVYALKVDRLPKLTRSVDLDTSQPGFDLGFAAAAQRTISVPNGGTIRASSTADGGSKIEAKGGSLAYLAELLSKFVGLRVVDSTGLRGYFDFTLTVSPEDIERTLDPGRVDNLPPRANPTGESTPSLRDSLKALGLKLEAANQQVDVLIIDHVEGVPTDN